jgi:ATP-dependent DNA helicase RecQ
VWADHERLTTDEPEVPVDEIEQIAAVARRVFGWRQLRPGQADAVAAVVGGRDVLAVMATGYGKSAIYQLAGHLLDGPTVVVSPLISLQLDQVRHLGEATGGTDAVAVNSAQSKRRNAAAWAAVATGETEFLFLAPEQLARDEVIDELTALEVGLVVVDEAHCVSAWGHDFRPDYLRLGGMIERLGGPRILALTATGSSPVREEIVRRLGMRDPQLFVRGFDRPNLHLAVVRHETGAEKDRAVLDEVVSAPKPGLLYVATHAEAERMAQELHTAGLRSAAYHGGLPAGERRETQERFQADEFDAVVATSAFGMGIDKPDVRFVVHADITDSIDSYYQEIGRGGRDGAPAAITLHYRQEDLGLRRFFAAGSPADEHVDAVVRSLRRGESGRRELSAVAAVAGLPGRTVGTVVNLLLEAGLADEHATGLALTRAVTLEQARAAASAVSAQRRHIEESRLAMMRAYAETLGCRRQFLLRYFGDDLAEPCGNCDTCESGTAYLQQPDASVDAGGFHEGDRVHHAAWGAGEVVSVGADRLTVFFESAGYRVLSLEAVAEGHLLS